MRLCGPVDSKQLLYPSALLRNLGRALFVVLPGREPIRRRPRESSDDSPASTGTCAPPRQQRLEQQSGFNVSHARRGSDPAPASNRSARRPPPEGVACVLHNETGRRRAARIFRPAAPQPGSSARKLPQKKSRQLTLRTRRAISPIINVLPSPGAVGGTTYSAKHSHPRIARPVALLGASAQGARAGKCLARGLLSVTSAAGISPVTS